jgi:hypothetical protein
MNFNELLKSKTFWTGVGGIVTTLGAVFTGNMTWSAALMPIITSLVGLFVKDALISQTKELKG